MEKTNNGTCTLCEGKHNPENYIQDRIREIMEEKHLCFRCANWLWQHELDQNDPARQGNVAVINGKHYLICPSNDGNWPSGFGGVRFKIRFLDGREVICDNLWHQGEIPDHLRHLFPDNAVFVKEDGFQTCD